MQPRRNKTRHVIPVKPGAERMPFRPDCVVTLPVGTDTTLMEHLIASMPERKRVAIKGFLKYGQVMVNGVVTGEIHGTVNGIMRATVDGDVDLNLISGDITNAEREKMIPAHTGEEAEHEHQA